MSLHRPPPRHRQAFPRTTAQAGALRGLRKRALAGAGSAELLWDDFFAGCWAVETQSS